MPKQFPPELIELSKSISATADILNQGLPEIDEAHFVNLFLPILTSSDPNVDYTPWLAVCGRGSVPVRVYRLEGTNKKYLYTVPAILDASGITKTVYTSRRSMSHAIMDATAQAQARPATMRDKIIYENISRADVGKSTENEKSIAQWNYILRRYGMEPISDTLPEDADLSELMPLEKATASKVSGGTTVAVEGFEEDDW